MPQGFVYILVSPNSNFIKIGGTERDANYASAERAVIISFQEDFANAERLFDLPGVRRALIAYWSEALADLRERQANSVYARYHSYDAVSALLEYKRARDKVSYGDPGASQA